MELTRQALPVRFETIDQREKWLYPCEAQQDVMVFIACVVCKYESYTLYLNMFLSEFQQIA